MWLFDAKNENIWFINTPKKLSYEKFEAGIVVSTRFLLK